MATTTPNRRCPCGYTKFREARSSVAENVTRWVKFSDVAVGGFGVTEFGTFFGAGDSPLYGLFPGTKHLMRNLVACASCGRSRSTKDSGGAVPFGMYIEDGVAVVVASDVSRPIAGYSLSAYEALGLGFEVQLSYRPGLPQALLTTTPTTVSETVPLGASFADTMLVAVLPEVVVTADYIFTFIDNNSGYETPLATIFLEAP